MIARSADDFRTHDSLWHASDLDQLNLSWFCWAWLCLYQLGFRLLGLAQTRSGLGCVQNRSAFQQQLWLQLVGLGSIIDGYDMRRGTLMAMMTTTSCEFFFQFCLLSQKKWGKERRYIRLWLMKKEKR